MAVDMDFPELSVLIIDDDELFLNFCKNLIIKEFKSECLLAQSPKKALNALNISKPSLIILDMKMPVMDGFSFLSLLRQNKDTNDIPVIACSNLMHKDLILGLKELNIMDYIIKSNSIDAFKTRIGRALETISHKKEGFLNF